VIEVNVAGSGLNGERKLTRILAEGEKQFAQLATRWAETNQLISWHRESTVYHINCR
jgi:hypothetical protein